MASPPTVIVSAVGQAVAQPSTTTGSVPASSGLAGSIGSVTLIRRFGSAANLNIHQHGLVLDGVYRCDADGAPIFVEATAPADHELHPLLQAVIARLMKLLTCRGVLVKDMGQTYLAEPDVDGEEARTPRPAAAPAPGRRC